LKSASLVNEDVHESGVCFQPSWVEPGARGTEADCKDAERWCGEVESNHPASSLGSGAFLDLGVSLVRVEDFPTGLHSDAVSTRAHATRAFESFMTCSNPAAKVGHAAAQRAINNANEISTEALIRALIPKSCRSPWWAPKVELAANRSPSNYRRGIRASRQRRSHVKIPC
jgi:hypothetical protein